MKRIRRCAAERSKPMKMTFWGVRGSLAAPQTALQIQDKITAVVQRISAADIQSPDARQFFLSQLPAWLYGTAGGNTPCTELETDSGTHIILDAGTGLRELSVSKHAQSVREWHLFLSHYHWDHIQGLPFFTCAYNPQVRLHIYGQKTDMHQILSAQMSAPYFPVSFDDSFSDRVLFHPLEDGDMFELGSALVSCRRLNHPGGSFAYSFEEGQKKFIYATDVELTNGQCCVKPEHDFFKHTDILVFDAQYTELEADIKRNWGHSAFGDVIDFAENRGVKKVYFFHHDPAYSDKQLYAQLDAARRYIEVSQKTLAVDLACEGKTVIV